MDRSETKGILEARIRQMAEGNIRQENFSLEDFDPAPQATNENSIPVNEKRKGKAKSNAAVSKASLPEPTGLGYNGKCCMDAIEYGQRFFINRPYSFRVSFSMNRTTLDILRKILYDMESRTSLSSFIENILLDHLQTYRTLINDATADKIRKPTIPNI